MKKRIWIKNAAILTATSLILRTIGIFFRMYMSGAIGAEGMGLYQLIFSIYVLASTFASSGISTAVTRMVADELACGTKKSVLQVVRRSVLVSAILGVISAGIVFSTADPIGTWWIKDVRAIPALKILTVGLPFMGIASCLRGYFIAREKAGVTASGQLVEQAIRIAVTMGLIERMAAGGITAACVAVIVGDTVAETAACGYMALRFWWDQRKLSICATTTCVPRQGVLKRLWNIAAPITAGRYLNTGLRTIENILVPSCLTAYLASSAEGLSQFGMLKGMVMPLLFFPASFLNAITTLLIPEVSRASTLQQHRTIERAVNRSLQTTLLSSILISGLFTVFADEIGMWVYHEPQVGFLLKVLAPLMPIMYLESIVDGMLKGLNQQVSSLKYSVWDSVIRILLIRLLVPQYGMGGFLFIMVLSNYLTCGLNLHRLLTVTGVAMRWVNWVFKPVFAICVTGLTAVWLWHLPAFAALPQVVAVGLLGLLIAAGYLVLMPLLGCVKKDDLPLKKRVA